MSNIQNDQFVVQNKKKNQWRNEFDFPSDLDYIGEMLNDNWGQQVIFKNEKKQKQKKQKNLDDKKLNFMPVIAVKLVQKIVEQVWFQDVSDYEDDITIGQKVAKLFNMMINNVLLNNRKIRRNKRFLRMIFNPVDQELNNAINKGKITEAEKIYFDLLDDYGVKVMNFAKLQLRAAFERAMTERWIELQALNKSFRVDGAKKQQILLKYLMKIKFELYDGRISGSVDGKQVEECFTFNMEE